MMASAKSMLVFGLGIAITLALPATVIGQSWPPATNLGPCTVSKETDVTARMRDGTLLYADVYRPATSEKVPMLLMRSPYGKDKPQVQPSLYQSPSWFALHCYIVVIQDVRGQFASKGVFYPYVHEMEDGYDSVEWAARLPGSDGNVGMYGSSYVGATQWLAAVAGPPSLKAIAPSNTSSEYYDGWTYEGGVFRLSFVLPWIMNYIAPSAAENRGDAKLAARLREQSKSIASWMQYRPYSLFPPLDPASRDIAPYFFDAIRHSSDDAYWQRVSIKRRYSQIKVPALAFGGWYDAFLRGGVENFEGMRESGGTEAARLNQRIVIGPWEHIGWGRPDSIVSPRLKAIGPVANSPVNELTVAWFDHFLKGKNSGIATGPRVDYFRMGDNRWLASGSWPIAGTEFENWYLASGGHAASLIGDGALSREVPPAAAPTDRFDYSPGNPVPSLGGHSCCAWFRSSQGQFDQSAIEQRSDVLVYTSAALTEPMEVTGPVSVTLYAKSSAPDTDFTAKLVDVFPDGTAVNLTNGIQQARFRDSLSTPALIRPGWAYKYTIQLWPTSNLFKPGHKIRLEISSSDFPQFAPNPNTGESFGASKRWQTARQTILHDAEHPSALVLPVIPAGARDEGLDTPPEK